VCTNEAGVSPSPAKLKFEPALHIVVFYVLQRCLTACLRAVFLPSWYTSNDVLPIIIRRLRNTEAMIDPPVHPEVARPQ
jgi:hypothetical protein